MKNWEDLTLLQKIFFGSFILTIAVLAPEFALLIQFGGIEVAFAFLLIYLKPAISWFEAKYSQLESRVLLAYFSFKQSASTKPSVFITQAAFCCLALFITGSAALSFTFFMPALLFNSVLM